MNNKLWEHSKTENSLPLQHYLLCKGYLHSRIQHLPKGSKCHQKLFVHLRRQKKNSHPERVIELLIHNSTEGEHAVFQEQIETGINTNSVHGKQIPLKV